MFHIFTSQLKERAFTKEMDANNFSIWNTEKRSVFNRLTNQEHWKSLDTQQAIEQLTVAALLHFAWMALTIQIHILKGCSTM